MKFLHKVAEAIGNNRYSPVCLFQSSKDNEYVSLSIN